MGYDLHIVRTRDWTEAANAPVTKDEVDALVINDPHLEWSTTDYVDMEDETEGTTRYFMITWRGEPCFWWYRDQIQCSCPDDAQQIKLAQIARTLNAYTVGDDGERYELQMGPTGNEELVILHP